jgi:collagenase-like PrtC family protease
VSSSSPSENPPGSGLRFSIGFNFDPLLVAGLTRLNEESSLARIDEVYAALPDCPISSARPTTRLPRVAWPDFASLVQRLAERGIAFNYLMNTSQECDASLGGEVRSYLRRLSRIGVSRFTMGTPQLCELAKRTLPRSHVTMSITRGIRTGKRLVEARDAGADAAYLDGVFVNRDFESLRALARVPGIEPRLYANMSCISGCPLVRQHYRAFAGEQGLETESLNDSYFAGCSLVKLRSPNEWIQMPWIRPEDIPVYAHEGIRTFKLSDRLAPTEVLLHIAEAYLSGESPPDLFALIDRDGVKYDKLLGDGASPEGRPLSIRADRIPHDFIEHFRKGECTSREPRCQICSAVARLAVERHPAWKEELISPDVLAGIPAPLLARAQVDEASDHSAPSLALA